MVAIAITTKNLSAKLGAFFIVFSDKKFDPLSPNSAFVLLIDDAGVLELSCVFQKIFAFVGCQQTAMLFTHADCSDS